MLDLAATDPRLVTAMLVAAAALLAAVATAYGWWRAHGYQQARLDELRRFAALQARHETTEAVLNTDPDALFLWAPSGQVKLYGGANLRANAAGDPFDAFCALLSGASCNNLHAAMAALRDTGQRFAFPLVCEDERTFAVTGKPAGPGMALWVSDVTVAFQEISALRDSLRETLAERQVLQDAIDQAPFPVWRRDTSRKLVWANQAYCKALGAASVEAVLARAEDLLDESALSEAEQYGDAQRVRTVVNGARRVIDLHEVPVNDGSFGVSLDVTELDEARRALRGQIAAQHETINLLHTPMALFSAKKQLEFYNRGYAELWDLTADFLAGGPDHSEVLEAMRVSRRLPEQADFPAWKRRRLSLYTELIDSLEELWHLPDGRTLRVVTQPRPQGGLLILYEDLTAMLTLERSFNALARVQSESINGLREGVAVSGIDGRLDLYNPAIVRMWGFDTAYLQTRPHFDQLLNMARPFVVNSGVFNEIAARFSDAEAGRTTSNVRMERTDGSVLDCTIVPLPDGGAMITFSDVSDSVRIERALRDRNEALETADRMKSEFVSHISYHLRTPLNTIIGFGEILEQEFFGTLNPRQHEYTSGLLVASHHLLTMVNDIIDFATIETGNMKLEPAPVNVYGALTSVADLARNLAQESDIRLQIDCPQQHSVILADSRRIKQAMFNLLSNAFRYSSAGEVVTIGANHVTGKDGESICQLWVRDTGIGVDLDFQQNMFDVFKARSRYGKTQGAGIGLALVRKLIELHGGWVEIDSLPGKGAMITCNLPQATIAVGAPERGDA